MKKKLNKIWVLILALPFSISAAATEMSNSSDSNIEPTVDLKVEDPFVSDREVRQWAVVGSLSYLDLWTLGKMGISASRQSRRKSWDVQYQQGSLGYDIGALADLGKVSEQRLHVIYRSYGQRSHFNWFYGGFYNLFKVEIGDDILNNITLSAFPNVDVLELHTVGLTWGFGHRWQRKNGFVIGIDWFEVSWPVYTISEDAAILGSDAQQSDINDVIEVMDFLTKLPALTIGRLQLGYSF